MKNRLAENGGALGKADDITADQRPSGGIRNWAGVRVKVITRRVNKDQPTVLLICSDALNDIVPGSSIALLSVPLNKLLRRS